MKSGRVERLLSLIHALESGRSLTAEELAEIVGVSRRTVFRDLGLLAKAGIEYAYDHQTRRYSARNTTLLPPVTLSHAETLTLLLAARQMSEGATMPDLEAAASAAIKLESMLPTAVRDYCGPIANRMDIRPDPVSDVACIRETIVELQSALTNQRKVTVRYDSYFDGKVIDEVLHPYRLAHIHRGWYLIAMMESVDQVRTFKVERFLRLHILDDGFETDATFSLDDYFGNAWLMIRGDQSFHVKIRFLPKVAGNVDEVQWHKTQRTSYNDDGELIFDVDVDGIEEISWWILGYGDQAQVIEPPELRRLMAERTARMYEYYNPGAVEVAGEGITTG